MRFQRKLDHPQLDAILERSDALVRSIREYKLPVIPMVTDSIDEATRTFGLLNTEGTQMSDLDLVVALTWQTDYDLRKHLDEAKGSLARIGWEDLDEKYILAVLRTAFDLDIYDKDTKLLGERLRDEPGKLQQAVDGLVAAGHFRAERCGVVSLSLLPYSYQGVVLADVLRRFPDRSPEVDEELERWFWWTTAWTTFAGISGYRMTAMLAYLREVASGQAPPWPWKLPSLDPSNLPGTADPRGALARAITLEMFAHQGRPKPLLRRLEAQGAKALTRGLARLPSPFAADLGNAFLVRTDDELSLQAALKSRSQGEACTLDDNPEARAHHLIDDEAWAQLGQGSTTAFVERRRELIESHHRGFLADKGLPPGARKPRTR
jgi:hypothetical protein